MPNEYRIAVDTESTPPRATLVDAAGVVVASTEIESGSNVSSVTAWAETAAAAHEAALAADAAGVAANAAATTTASNIKAAVEAEVIVV